MRDVETAKRRFTKWQNRVLAHNAADPTLVATFDVEMPILTEDVEDGLFEMHSNQEILSFSITQQAKPPYQFVTVITDKDIKTTVEKIKALVK